MKKSHGSRLEDMCDLRIDCRVVSSVTKLCTVAGILVIGDRYQVSARIDKFSRDEKRQPFVVDYALVGGDGKLSSTVEQPLVFTKFCIFIYSISVSFIELPSPPLVNTVPQYAHTEQERVLISTWISNNCGNMLSQDDNFHKGDLQVTALVYAFDLSQ